jgi:HprK-related kinase A
LKLQDLDLTALNTLLKTTGLKFSMGPFNISCQSKIPKVSKHFHKLYADYNLVEGNEFIDFHINVNAVWGLRHWIKPQVTFAFDDYEPFAPLPYGQASAMFEWGLNWCIANSSHQFLIIHSAVIEKNGICIIMPGSPGSGKSTLCSALILNGWRLLSDEMTLYSLEEQVVYPVPRPVSLKNQSIDIIKGHSDVPVYGDIIPNTLKGNLTHMKPPADAVKLQDQTVPPKFVIFPHYQKDSDKMLEPLSPGNGFHAVINLVESVDCYDFTYNSLDEGLTGIEEVTGTH